MGALLDPRYRSLLNDNQLQAAVDFISDTYGQSGGAEQEPEPKTVNHKSATPNEEPPERY